MIQTVKGPIPASDLGVTMAHEHLSVDLAGVRSDSDSVFTHSPLVLGEMNDLRNAGVDSVIEVSCLGMGRNVFALRHIADETGLNVVCSTGFYLESYHPAWIADASIKKIEDTFEREFADGIDGSDVKPGVIGEIAGEKNEITLGEQKVMIAAAHVASRVGCAVTTHCQLGQMALEQAALLTGEGLAPEKVVLGHMDLANDLEYYKRVLDLGVNIGFDTCGKDCYLSDDVRADNLARLVELGYERQIVLSADVSRQSYMAAKGGNGYVAVMKRVVPMLRERGVTESSIQTMLIANPARIFDIEGGLS